MAFKKKIKKVNKLLLTIYLFLSISFIISLVLLTINLSNLTGIETFYRILSIVFLSLMLILYILYGFIWLFKKKHIKLSIFSFFILLFICISLFASYYINKTYNIIDNINKNEITYTTNLIVLKNYDFLNSQDEKIGMISDENDVAGHILANELIIKENLNNIEIIYFDDYYEMFDNLNNKEIQGLFVTSNYESLFIEEEEYSSIAKETKVVKTLSKTMEKKVISSNKKLSDPFTILLLGIDSISNGLNKNAAFNGDSIMLITFNPQTLSATFLSIPRDTLVPVACRKNQEAKINSSAYSGVSCMIDTITNFTGIEIDYYVKMNFTGVVDLVNAVGGIEVDVPYSFCEQDSKRRFDEHLIYINEGYQKLNGEQALALSRNRKPHYQCEAKWNQGVRNDFVRGQNQQLVVQALINKTKDIKNVDSLYNILSAISNNMDTNMETNQILSFYEVIKKLFLGVLQGRENLLKIDKLYLQTSNLMINKIGSAEIYQNKSLDEVVKAMKINLAIIKEEPIKTFSYDANIPYETPIIGKGLFDNVKRETLPNFIGKNKEEAINWGNANKVSITTKEITLGDPLYNPEYLNNTVVYQSIPARTLLNNITSLVITIQIISE